MLKKYNLSVKIKYWFNFCVTSCKINKMRTAAKKSRTEFSENYKLKIDAKTVITLKTKEAVKAWLERYPKAVLIEQ